MFASKDLFFTRPSGYQISRSVRTRSSASGYFNRTPASAGNRQKFTISMWIKRGVSASAGQWLMAASTGTANQDCYLCFGGSISTGGTQDTLAFFSPPAGNSISLITNALYRDFSAWYHVVCAVDTTQATAANRILLYVNGVQITSFSTATYPTLNQNLNFNNTTSHTIASATVTPSNFFDGYLTEINFIDGQQLTPTSFGQFNTVTGVWQPIKYTGTYGTNGFYLNFSDNSNNTATTIGKDYSGNGNNWTPNNISVTAGTTYDSMLDVPTPYADGGNGRGNYATLNPLDKLLSPTVVDGNLGATVGDNAEVRGTIYVSSGKWYWEVVPTTMTFSFVGIGIGGATKHWATTGISYYGANGNKYVNGTASAYGASYTNNDVIGVALDLDNLQITFYKNNTSQGTITGLTAGSYALALSAAGNSSVYATNFGQRPFTYTPPTGFVALNTQNLPTPTISNGATVMAATLYTGNATARTIANTVNGVSMQPDLVWLKMRSSGSYLNHHLVDSVRGDGKVLYSNLTNAEDNLGSTAIYTTSTGFGLSAGVGVNENSQTFVGWQWNAGGSTVTNTSGSISSQVRANATAGFSVVTYTANNTAGATIGHGLSVAPSFIIVKSRSAVNSWNCYHTSLGNTKGIDLNGTGAASTNSLYWNNTSPTSSVFSVSTFTNNSTSTYVAYCFAAVAGYSAFGSYTGNGSADGPFVFTNFRPRWVMIKRTDTGGDSWLIIDTTRSSFNVTQQNLFANLSSAETATSFLDVVSNGFKLRQTFSDANGSGATYIFAAFAENPFKLSLAR